MGAGWRPLAVAVVFGGALGPALLVAGLARPSAATGGGAASTGGAASSSSSPSANFLGFRDQDLEALRKELSSTR